MLQYSDVRLRDLCSQLCFFYRHLSWLWMYSVVVFSGLILPPKPDIHDNIALLDGNTGIVLSEA